MSDGLNRVMLLGNLGADPELKMLQGGQAVLKLRLATSESYLDKNKVKQERVEWHSCIIWNKRAEALAKFLSKGARVFIEGRLQTTSYDNKEGVKVYKTEIVANNVILCGGGGDRGGQRQAPQPAPTGDSAEPDGGDFGGDGDFPF